MSERISHSGVIERILDNCVQVRILQTSACAACKVAGHCNASESKVKLVDVDCTDVSGYRPGQEVVVSASRDVAGKALLLGFGVPLLVMVVVLVVALGLKVSEGMAALAALGALVPYYVLLWVFRDRIQRQISFQIDE